MLFLIIIPVLCSVPVFIGIFFLFRWRKLLRTRTISVSELKEGITEVKGEILSFPGQELTAPITGLPCVMYDTEVYYHEYEKLEGRRKHVKRTRWSERKGGMFLVRDATGSVRVDPKGVDIGMENVFHESLEPLGRPSKRVESLCARKGIDFDGLLGIVNRPFNFREKILRPGVEVFILAYAEKDTNDPGAPPPASVSQYILKKKGDMLISFEGEKAEISRSKTWGIGLILFGTFMALLSAAFYFIGIMM